MSTTAPLSEPIEVFYSYWHTDKNLRVELETTLANLKRQGILTDCIIVRSAPALTV